MLENRSIVPSHAEELYHVSREQIHNAIAICSYKNKFSDCVKQLQQLLHDAKDQEAIISWVGGQSTGKSTFINGLLQFPVLPTAQEVTSSCPVEIRFGSVPALEVFMVNQDGSEETLAIYENPRISNELFHQLKEYALLCFNNNVIDLDSINYFCDTLLQKTGPDDTAVDADVLQMDPGDPRHVITLMMIPLAAYVGQNAAIAHVESEALVRSERTRLLDQIIPHEEGQVSYAEKDYCLRLWWNSEFLDQKLIIVDLPGLGSVTEVRQQEDEEDADLQRLSHAQITTRYAQNSDSMFMLFGPEARRDDMDVALRSLLDGERMKRIVDKDSRFVVLVNKADLAVNIFAPAPKIHAILEGVNLPRIYPVSGLHGEYQMVRSGGIPVTRTKLYRSMLAEKMDEWLEDGYSDEEIQQEKMKLAQRACNRLEANYRKEYPYDVYEPQPSGQSESRRVKTGRESISLERFMNEFIHDYAHRIQYLKTLDMVVGSGGILDGVLKEIELRASIIDMMHKCGADVTQAVFDSIAKAVNKALNDFSGKLSNIRLQLNQKAQEANTRVQDARNDILAGLACFEKSMSSDISSTIGKMETNIMGGRAMLDKGNNRSLFDSLIYRLKAGDFRKEPTAKDGIRKLDKVITEQQEIFDQGILDLRCEYEKIPGLCKTYMDAAFAKQENEISRKINALAAGNAQANAAKGQAEEGWAIFSACYANVSGAVLNHIETIVAKICSDLTNNSRMKAEIKKTSDRLEEFYKVLDTEYNSACVRAVESCKDETLFRSKGFVKVKELEKSLREPFVDPLWRSAQMDVLNDILLRTPQKQPSVPKPKGIIGRFVNWLFSISPSDGGEPEKCHNDRVIDALQDIDRSGAESRRHIQQCYPTIQENVSDLSDGTGADLIRELGYLKTDYAEPLRNIFEPIVKSIGGIPEHIGVHPQLSPTISLALTENTKHQAAVSDALNRIDGYINVWKGDSK